MCLFMGTISENSSITIHMVIYRGCVDIIEVEVEATTKGIILISYKIF